MYTSFQGQQEIYLIYLLLPLKRGVHDTCIPPASHFLNIGYLLRTTDNSNCFWFRLKIRVVGSRLQLPVMHRLHCNWYTMHCWLSTCSFVWLTYIRGGPGQFSYKYGLDCGMELLIKGYNYPCHIISRHSRRSLRWRWVSNPRKLLIWGSLLNLPP